MIYELDFKPTAIKQFASPRTAIIFHLVEVDQNDEDYGLGYPSGLTDLAAYALIPNHCLDSGHHRPLSRRKFLRVQ